MDEKVKEAIKLLRDNDYIVKKLSPEQVKDSADCDESGGDKECFECSCSVCLVQ